MTSDWYESDEAYMQDVPLDEDYMNLADLHDAGMFDMYQDAE